MLQSFLKLFSVNDKTLSAIPKPKNVSNVILQSIRREKITSNMYMNFYKTTNLYEVFQLQDRKNCYFIRDSKMIEELILFETSENNQYTKRKQRYKYNQSLLNGNPVSMSSLNSSSYLKQQHKLFFSLVRGIDDQIQLINTNVNSIHGKHQITRFIIDIVAQCYFPMLFNISNINIVLDELIELLNILEEATGKYHITFGDLDLDDCPYDDTLEIQYLNAFLRLLKKLKYYDTDDYSPNSSADLKTNLCNEILSLVDPKCNIMNVLLTQFNYTDDSVAIVNNMLSWIDNMLNVVYTVINFLLILADKNEVFNDDFCRHNISDAKSLATMFMRQALVDFDIIDSNGNIVSFHAGDIIMMSNGNDDMIFGGMGRRCPSKPWSYIFIKSLLKFITDNYRLTLRGKLIKDVEHDSWFWNKYSCNNFSLNRIT